jgi:signal transduction histidine kinase
MDPETRSTRPLEPEAEDRRLRRRGIAVVVAYFTMDAIMRAGYFHFGALADGRSPPFADALLSEVTGSTATLVVFFAIVVPMCRRFPVRRDDWLRRVLPHFGGLVAFSLVKTVLMWAQRWVLWPVAGLGSYDYGHLVYRFPMEAANDVSGYLLLAAAVHLFDTWRERRARELMRARLEARMSEARLAALQGQLHPHFLFNTLNVISSVLYDDPRRADELISRLSDLLRASLDASSQPEVPLEEELAILERYVELMETRFEDRLSVEVTVDRDAYGTSVPIFLVQPLVENAIQYAVAPRAEGGAVRVTVSRDGPMLAVVVDDDGPGIPGEPQHAVGQGVGLGNLRDRLAYLYEASASLELENRPEGGLRVRVRIPWRRSPMSSELPPGSEGRRRGALELEAR